MKDRPSSPGPRRVLCIAREAKDVPNLEQTLQGVSVELVSDAASCLRLLDGGTFDLLVVDLDALDVPTPGFLAAVRASSSLTPVLAISDRQSTERALDAVRHGARDYLLKPVDSDQLRSLVTEALRDPTDMWQTSDSSLTSKRRAGGFDGMIGTSPLMLELYEKIRRVARTGATVLISGESGTGKELVARSIHRWSPRADGAFVPVHTGAIPRELIASELFGHDKGSFTGAVSDADGKFAAAHRGTVFLDEISTMDLAVQVALLRVLETFRFTRVGGRKEHTVDVRVIAATNHDLQALVRAGAFREDLFYRLNVVPLVLPPLRDRGDDIIVLAEQYLVHFAQRYGSPPRRLRSAAIEMLREYHWPGNVRELRNVMEQTALFCQEPEVSADSISLTQLPLHSVGERMASPPPPPRVTSSSPPHPDAATTPPPHLHADIASPVPVVMPSVHTPGLPMEQIQVVTLPLSTSIDDAERLLILRTLEWVGGNKVRAARVLGISRRSLYNKLALYGQSAQDDEADDHDPAGGVGPGDRGVS